MAQAIVAVFCCFWVGTEAFTFRPRAKASFLDIQSESSNVCSQMWNGKAVYGADGENKCKIVQHSQHWTLGGGVAPKMCVRPYADFVSTIVSQQQRWPDCSALSVLWKKLDDAPVQANCSSFAPCGGTGVKKLFVDVGANIGACTIEMLARPDVTRAVSFEPNPKNLFYLTGSVLQNPGYSSKLSLFPMALGKSDGSHKMHMEPGNAGNTVLDSPGPTVSKVQAVEAKTITLDGVFLEGGQPPYIHLMKMDAQGFEVNILKGGSRLLASGAINAIKFELAPAWLIGQGTSAAELFSILWIAGYNLYHFSGDDIAEDTALPSAALSHEYLTEVACKENGVPPRDFFAVYSPTKAGKTNQEIACPK